MIKDEKRHRVLEPVDLKIIFDGAGSWYMYYAFLYHTGLRANDVASLKYGNIDLKKKSRKVDEFMNFQLQMHC